MTRKQSFVDLNELGGVSNKPAPAADLNNVANENQFLNEADMQRPKAQKNKGGRKPVKNKAKYKKEVYFTEAQDEEIRSYCQANIIDFSRLVKTLLIKEGIIHI